MSFSVSFFDSGIGGIIFGATLVNETLSSFSKLLDAGCDVNLTYVCDNLNAPYYGKSFEQMLNIGNSNLKVLANQGADITFLACNTISSQSAHLDIPKELDDSIHFLIQASGDMVVDVAKSRILEVQSAGGAIEEFWASIWATERTIKNLTYQNYIQKAWAERGVEGVKLMLHTFGPPWSAYVQQDFESSSFDKEAVAKLELDQLLSSPQYPKSAPVFLYCTHFPFYSKMITEQLISYGRFDSIFSQGAIFRPHLEEKIRGKIESMHLGSGTISPSFANSSVGKHGGRVFVKIITTGNRMQNVEDFVQKLHNLPIADVSIVAGVAKPN